MLPPRHGYLENTLASMRASFEAGADIVEIDVHPTTDGRFAVFHDWTLDCRTDGHGVTREHSMAQLKALDIGYGYVPINIAPWLWGWPNRLQQRLHNVGSEAYVRGPYHGGGFSVGLDTAEDWARLPEEYSGGIYTDEIVAVARWIKRGRQP